MEKQSSDRARPRSIADLTEEEFAAKLDAMSARAAERHATQQAAAERRQWWVEHADGSGEPPPDAKMTYDNRPGKSH